MYRITIGDTAYSSWSLRGWLLLAAFDLPFEQNLVRMYDPAFDAMKAANVTKYVGMASGAMMMPGEKRGGFQRTVHPLLSVMKLVSPDVGFAIVLAAVVTNIVISVLFSGNVHDVFARVNTREGEVQRYMKMFQLMYSMPDSAGKLAEIKREATERGGGIHG